MSNTYVILYAMNIEVIYKTMRKVMRGVLMYLFYITKCIIFQIISFMKYYFFKNTYRYEIYINKYDK